MKQVIYTTIVVKSIVEFENKVQFQHAALEEAERIKSIVPDSTIEDIEIANGLITTSIK